HPRAETLWGHELIAGPLLVSVEEGRRPCLGFRVQVTSVGEEPGEAVLLRLVVGGRLGDFLRLPQAVFLPLKTPFYTPGHNSRPFSPELVRQLFVFLLLGDGDGEGHELDAPPNREVSAADGRLVVGGEEQLPGGPHLEEVLAHAARRN